MDQTKNSNTQKKDCARFAKACWQSLCSNAAQSVPQCCLSCAAMLPKVCSNAA